MDYCLNLNSSTKLKQSTRTTKQNRHFYFNNPRLFHLKTPKLLPKNAYFIAKFLKFADGDAEAPLSVFLFHYKYHFKEAEEFFVSSALIFATQK